MILVINYIATNYNLLGGFAKYLNLPKLLKYDVLYTLSGMFKEKQIESIQHCRVKPGYEFRNFAGLLEDIPVCSFSLCDL